MVASSQKFCQVRAAGVSFSLDTMPLRGAREEWLSYLTLFLAHTPLVLLGVITQGGLLEFSGLVR